MATIGRRSFRAALVACAPPLARIHERIFQALDISERGSYGKPGGGCLSPTELIRVKHGHSIPCLGAGPDGPVFLAGKMEGFDPRTYQRNLAPEVEFGLRYFAEEWLSKLDDGKQSADKTATTWERFNLAEDSCRVANQDLKRQWSSSPFEQEISLARKISSRILGRFDWNQAARGFGWGPGATTRLSRRKADAAHKYCGNPQTTIGNALLANAAIQCVPQWFSSIPELPEDIGVGRCYIVPGNRVVTVPKNYKTDRTIAIEPDMNIYVQKGIGALMRNRLKRVGVDLDDQTRNQRGALIGSLSGLLSTIDLSMASDTISRAVVELMIRPDWLEALGQSRSPFGVLPSGEKIFYQKFSSMGNGFTFELETVIFYSLALACAVQAGEEVHRISVYGDDIVIPTGCYDRLCGLLRFMGFTPNGKKSYSVGSFRESCGKHFFSGFDVTPFYVKSAPKTLMDLFKIHNQIYRFEKRCTWLGPYRCQKLQEVRAWLRSYAPARWRKPTLLDGFGDGAFVGEFDEVTPQRCRRGWDGYRMDSIVTTSIPDPSFEGYGILVKALQSLERVDRQSLCYFTGEEDSFVAPVKGKRYSHKRLFASASKVSQQCACPSCRMARGILA